MPKWILLAVSLVLALAAVFALLPDQTARANSAGGVHLTLERQSAFTDEVPPVPRLSASDTISPTLVPFPSGIYLFQLIRGPGGILWFSEVLSGTQIYRIGKITASGIITDYPMPYPVAGMTTGPDGNVWYTGLDTNVLVKVTPQGSARSYYIYGGDCCLSEIVAGKVFSHLSRDNRDFISLFRGMVIYWKQVGRQLALGQISVGSATNENGLGGQGIS